MILSRILLMMIGLLYLTHCQLGETQKRIDSQASASSFYVEKISGSFVSESFNENISIPKDRTYQFSVCLKDLKKNKAITNHPFLIEEIKETLTT
ncbi:MAG: hypothetical protein L6Q37_06200, partial [Bdellovibrionaceae bacterium]|nr:hypothetical protein [Pseudobdellovibrionaceae bacterium]